MRVTGNIKVKIIFVALFTFHCSLFTVPLFGQNTSEVQKTSVFGQNAFSVQISPVIEIPLLTQFNVGFGAHAVIDWSFLTFGQFDKFNAGVSAGAGFSNMPLKAGNPLTFINVYAGPFIRYRPFDRWAFQANVSAGFYQFNFNMGNSAAEQSYTKLLFSFNVGADFYLSPYITLFAKSGYAYRVFDASLPFQSITASLGISINITEILDGRSRVKVEKSEQYRIFPVSWAWYEKNPVSLLEFTNEENNAITDVSISFFMDTYMGQPYVFTVLPRVSSGETVEVPVTALFNDYMLSLTENIIANGFINVKYRSLGSAKEAVVPVQMPVFHRNTMSWDDDRRAAAFVSSRDSAARMFSRYVASAVDLYMETGEASPALYNMPRNVLYAAAMFEALRLYGIAYVVNPAMAFSDMHGDASALDSIRYPYETLYYRGGDCGYLAILFCSLLEVLNIETAFITVPGHIYMAFEVGDSGWNENNQDIIEKDGKRWLPVEITVPEEGFMRAWRIGARQWRNYGDEAELFPIRECWEIYPSVTVSNSVNYLPKDIPDIIDIVYALEAELK